MGSQSGNKWPKAFCHRHRRCSAPAANLAVTLGSSAEWNQSELDLVDGIGFPGDQFQYPGNAATVVAYDGDWTGYNLVSFFTRANASFKDRYLLTASVRTDGSSRGHCSLWAAAGTGRSTHSR